MKKSILLGILLFGLVFLVACSNDNSTEIKKLKSEIEKLEATNKKLTSQLAIYDKAVKKSDDEALKYKPLELGQSHTFNKDFNGGMSDGLKITVSTANMDTNIQLNQEYSSENYTGMTPIIAKIIYENTSNKTIDLTSFSIIDSKGIVGKWSPYIDGVSTMLPDVLTPGQKVESTEVFAIKNPGGFDLTYNDVTWHVK